MISINAVTSPAVSYPVGILGRTLIFHINYTFSEKQSYYVKIDFGESHAE